MSEDLLTYQAAARQVGLSPSRLRQAAAPGVPLWRRLKVARFGHRTVRIRLAALEEWVRAVERRAA